MKTIVANKKAPDYKHQPNDVYIGRGSKWGNPYRIGIGGTRGVMCDKYTEHMTKLLREYPEKYNILELQGKRLVCFCKPARCHGDWLAAMANEVAQ